MKKNIYKLLIVLFVIIVTIIALVPINKNYTTVSWMKNLDDSLLISDMAIPGTHDSGALHSIFDVAGKCQDLNIKQQLKVGVRFLDIRLRLKNNELEVVHSFVEQKSSFESVLKDINDFIEQNDSEFLIVSIKQDESPVNSNINFDDKVITDISKYKSILLDTILPTTLGEARGNIYILNRFTNKEVGIPAYSNWQDSTTFDLNNLHIQDNYCINDFNTKKNDIIEAFNYSKNNNNLVLNFTSCYLDDAFPPSYAGTIAKEVNKWLDRYLETEEDISGIIIIDFATSKLVKKIYMENNYEKTN